MYSTLLKYLSLRFLLIWGRIYLRTRSTTLKGAPRPEAAFFLHRCRDSEDNLMRPQFSTLNVAEYVA